MPPRNPNLTLTNVTNVYPDYRQNQMVSSAVNVLIIYLSL